MQNVFMISVDRYNDTTSYDIMIIIQRCYADGYPMRTCLNTSTGKVLILL